MPLLSNSLFRDSEYKKDCEKKINYFDVINDNIKDFEESSEPISVTDNAITDGEGNDKNSNNCITCASKNKLYFETTNFDTEIIEIGNNYHKILK